MLQIRHFISQIRVIYQFTPQIILYNSLFLLNFLTFSPNILQFLCIFILGSVRSVQFQVFLVNLCFQ